MDTQGKTSVQVATAVAERVKARMADPRKIWGIPWGFPGLDTITGGIHEEELAILTARPSVGKTQILVHVAESVAATLKAEGKGRVLRLVLCEGTAETFMHRWACIRAGVSSKRVMNGSIRNDPEQADRFMDELRNIARLPVKYLDDAKTLDDVMGFLSSNHTAWWGMDHIQTCPYMPGKPNDGNVQVLTVIANSLAAVAKSVAPGLVLAHTPRDVDKREDRRPRLGDIKGSSSIEGAARVVLGAYTDRIYQKVPPEELNRPYIVELQVLKNNNGPGVGQTVDLMFHPKTGQFDDVSEIADTPED